MDLIKIVIVDDHQIVRDGIKAMFLASKSIQVIGEAADYDGLLKILQKNTPDLIVLDITLPGKSGIEIASEFKQRDESVKILMLSANTDEDSIIDAIHAGANGFLPKDTSKDEFIEAITAICNNEEFFGAKLSKVIYSSYISHVKNRKENEPEICLSEREIETMKLLADGFSTKEIADKLSISPRTVETHKSKILGKLNLNNIADLIKYAIKQGIVKL